jgi:hypothetical protein
MAKVTRIELTPDDPIFSGRPQMFVPISKPSISDSKPKQTPSINPMAKAAESLERTASELINGTDPHPRGPKRSEESTTPKDKENP